MGSDFELKDSVCLGVGVGGSYVQEVNSKTTIEKLEA